MYRVSKQPGISDDNRLYKRHRKRICSPSAFPIDLTIAEFLIGTTTKQSAPPTPTFFHWRI